MWFDAQLALAGIKEADKTRICAYLPATTATTATSATNTPKNPNLGGNVASVADVAGSTGEIPFSKKPINDGALIVQTVQFGASRHGAIATATNLGATVTYQLIDRLIASGRLCIAKDGALSVGGDE
jgi:hypothetical protein